MIQITAGKHKKRKLKSISKLVRPTSALRREAVFSMIESYSIKISYDFYKDKTFLDLFAGIGTMGLEAISRGINKVIFFENNEEVIDILKYNCSIICNSDQYEIINEDIIKTNFNIKFDNISLVYIDPPYNKYNLKDILDTLSIKFDKSQTLIIIETSIDELPVFPKNTKMIKEKVYGKSAIRILKFG